MADKDIIIGRVINVTGMIGVSAGRFRSRRPKKAPPSGARLGRRTVALHMLICRQSACWILMLDQR
jgi:hypothetical protein